MRDRRAPETALVPAVGAADEDLVAPVQARECGAQRGEEPGLDRRRADRHGAVVIPPDILPALAAAVARLQATKAVILAPARAGFADFAAFETAWAAFEAART
jgi:UDP-N-acetylmuramoylalanine-D-glutamate ligase